MPKLKTIYICEKCGKEHSKWSGQCASCHEWNTLIEDVISPTVQRSVAKKAAPLALQAMDIVSGDEERLLTGIEEFDRVLGGGIVPDGITLISGDPGIGKSTLISQVAAKIAAKHKNVFYFSGEESVQQIVKRLQRLQLSTEYLQVIHAMCLEEIVATIQEYKPDCVILDSVQVAFSSELPAAAGSISQVRAVTEAMLHVAKQSTIPVFLIGHVTKDGAMAGPMTLSHMVDTVLYLEGEKYQHFRILRSLKNRFGATSEVGIFAMEEEGMVEVKNPSAAFLEGRQPGTIGSAVSVTLEGTRPFLLEVQALTTPTSFGYPKRTSSGIHLNRFQLMIAVLNKYSQMKLDSQDAYLNVVGGFNVKDPACDLAICMAVTSSKLKIPLPHEAVFIGEVGLSGELRSVSQLERRLNDVQKLGFKKAYVPYSSRGVKAVKGLEIVEVKSVSAAVAGVKL